MTEKTYTQKRWSLTDLFESIDSPDLQVALEELTAARDIPVSAPAKRRKTSTRKRNGAAPVNDSELARKFSYARKIVRKYGPLTLEETCDKMRETDSRFTFMDQDKLALGVKRTLSKAGKGLFELQPDGKYYTPEQWNARDKVVLADIGVPVVGVDVEDEEDDEDELVPIINPAGAGKGLFHS